MDAGERAAFQQSGFSWAGLLSVGSVSPPVEDAAGGGCGCGELHGVAGEDTSVVGDEVRMEEEGAAMEEEEAVIVRCGKY